MKGIFNAHFWKFFTGLLIIMFLGIAAFFASNYYHYAKNVKPGVESATTRPASEN